MVTSTLTADPAGPAAAELTDGDHRGQLPPIRCQLPARTGQAGGPIRLSGRIPAGGDTQSIIMSPGHTKGPAGQGKAGCPSPAPTAVTADHPAPKGHKPEPLNASPPRALPATRQA